MANRIAPEGGAFLLDPPRGVGEIFTPERFSSEAQLMARTVEEFLRREVSPVNARLEAQETGLMHSLLQQAGQLGLLGAGVPEAYGGLDLAKSQILLLAEKTALNPSFAISAGVHSGVSILPLLYFGTEEQRAKYLPKLASGEWIGAFALSEAESGSDARNSRTRATLTQDGMHYLLNGTKMWITNGGFADLFTVFAQVDGRHFTAFLVERGFPGVTAEREEHKLGLKGSSTCRVVLENVRVPLENVLGEIGQGARPALYTLNLGRLAIAATALGMCKENLRLAIQYAKQRVQFGRTIASFGLIRRKLAEMAIRTFLLESMVYRTAGYQDTRYAAIAPDAPEAQEMYRAAAEEYAVECALCKFFGTEALAYVVDEALQIHGGYGFSEEFPIAQAYRDARVFRIFEGTNEINRLTVVDQLLRRDKAGRLALTRTIHRLFELDEDRHVPLYAEIKALFQGSEGLPPEERPLAEIDASVRYLRLTAIGALTVARSQRGGDLMEEQEIVALLAEMIAATYALDSAALRCRQEAESKPLLIAAAQTYAYQAGMKSWERLQAILATRWQGADQSKHIRLWRDVFEAPIGDVLPLRKEIASLALQKEDYPW